MPADHSTRRVMIRAGVAMLPVLLASGGGAQAQGAPASPRDLVELFRAALDARDAPRVAGFYAEQGVILNPRGNVTAGREQILAQMSRNFDAGMPRLRLVNARFDGDASSGVIIWVWEAEIAVQGQSPQRRRIRSMLYVKNTPEGWRIFADMFQDYPAPPA